MQITHTINLSGQTFTIDLNAYEALQAYLHDVESRLPADEREDVMADVECRVAELFNRSLFDNNQKVVTDAMVSDIKARIGAPSEFGPNGTATTLVNGKRKIRVNRTAATPSNNGGCLRATGIGCLILLIGGPAIFALGIALFAIGMATLGIGTGLFAFLGAKAAWATICALVAIALPIVFITYAIIHYLRNRQWPSGRAWLIALIIWIISLLGAVIPAYQTVEDRGGVSGIREQLEQLKAMSPDSLDAFIEQQVNNALEGNHYYEYHYERDADGNVYESTYTE